MDINVAIKKFRDFAHDELDAKGGAKNWFKINGARICSECPKHKRRTLYAHISEGSGIYLKCFRASCDLKRFATLQDFHDLGFNNDEVIKVLLDKSNRSDVRQFSSEKRPIVISDMIPSKEQLEYFKARTNIRLKDVSDVQKYRLIPNLYQVFVDNYDEDEPIFESLQYTGLTKPEKMGITFATEDYATFSYRHIKKSNMKLVLNPDQSNNTGYTLIRGDKDKIKTLVVTEGVFDLINIYTKFGIINDAKYIATFGFASFESDILYHFKQNIDTVKSLVMFADSDKVLDFGQRTYDKKVYDRLIKKINGLVGPDTFENIIIVYNTVTKDFGDMREVIKPKIVEIKGSISNV